MKMIANEWKFVGKNRLILISVLAIMIIPFLYSIFFLKSVWNPYGETQHLPVAVVNNDQPVKYQGQTMNVGDQAIKSLKKDHQLGWRFVSEKKAKQGLKDKKYYTIVTFPKDTSKNAASVLSKNPKKMDIQYETNGSLNYIGEVISQIGATGLNEKIRQTIIKAYADATFQQVKKVGKGMNTAAKGAKTLSKGQKTLGTGFDTYTAYVSQVNDGVQTMKMSVGPLSSGVGQLADGGKTLNNGLQTLNGKTGQLSSGVSQLADGSNQLVSGSGQVASGVRSYTGAVGALNSGIQTLNSQTGALAGGVGQLTNGSNALNNGLQTLNGETADLASGASQLSSGANQVNNGVQQYTNAVSQLNTGLSQISQNNGSITAGLNNIKNSSAELSELPTMLTAMQAVHDQTPGLQKNMQDLQSQMGSLNKLSELQKSIAGINLDSVNTDAATKGLQAAQDNAGAANSSFDKIAADINGTNLSDTDKQTAINAVQGDIAAGKKSALTAQAAAKGVSDGLGGMTATLAKIKPALSQLSGFDAASLSSTANSTFSQANTLLNTAGSLTSQDTINKLKNLAAQTTDMSKQLDDIQTYVDSVEKASAGTSQLNSQSGALVSGTSQLSNSLTQLNGQVPALTGGVSQLANGSQQLAGGLNQLNGSVPALTNGVAQLANGSSQITGNSAALVSGADQVSAGNSQLNGGIGQLNAQVPQLVGGVQQLANGSYQLSGGLDQLNSQIPALTDGVNQLADGTSQLNSNSPVLKDGTKKLVTGSVKLSDALGKGADQVNAMPLTSKTSDMFSAPTKLKHKSYSKVSNYGHALAPYVLSVALYVGAIIFNFAYPIRKVSMSGQSATAWFFSKATISLVVAVVQAVAETGLMMLFGLQVDHPGQMFAVSISFSIVSMFLVMFLSMLLDNPGRFIAMLILMLQLGGSGGTFPMQVTNGFYNVIHPYLPMTYSILGLRQGLTSGLGNDTVTQVVGLLLLMAVIFAVLLWLSMLWLQRKHLQGFSQLDDNQKLQDVEK